MKKTGFIWFALFIFVGAFLSGCKDSAPSGPTPGLGSVSVKKYVAVGNSLTAGYQSNGLYASAQAYSYPNMISQQLAKAGAALDTFQQPIYSDPGIPDPATGKAQRYVILSFTDPKNPVIGPEGLAPGTPKNSALARPYDNLGIPGIVVAHFLDTTNAGALANALIPLVLRYGTGSPFPKSVYKHVGMFKAMAQTPDLVTFWLGANDVLGYATSGGVKPTSPTPSATFGFLYKQALDSLRALLPNAKIVVATIPNVSAVPFFNTVGPKMAAGIPAGVYLRYQKHGNSGLAFDSTRLTVTEPGAPMITLKASAYAPLIGVKGGKWYRDNAYPALPAGIDTNQIFGFHPQNPFPDALVLDFSEQSAAATAILEFNAAITGAATADGAAVFDAFSFFNVVKGSGYSIAGEKYTADYISGGLFSLDGVHPSSRGYAIIANKFIETMNSSFGMTVPYVNVATIPGIAVPLGKYAAGSHIVPTIDPQAWKSFDALWGSGN